MSWLGLAWDPEGPEDDGHLARLLSPDQPAASMYRAHAERLLAEGRAYRCYCSAEELDARRAAAQARSGDVPLRRPLPRRRPPRPGVPAALRLRDPRRGAHGRARPDPRRGALRPRDARRLGPGPLGRHAHLQLLRRRGRRDDEDHATSSGATTTCRTRPSRSSATRRSAIRAPVFAHIPMILGADRSPAVQAPRRGVAAGVPRRGFLPRGDDQLPGPPGLGPRRPGAVHPRRAGPALRHPAGGRGGGDLRPDEARMGERPVARSSLGPEQRGAARCAPSWSALGVAAIHREPLLRAAVPEPEQRGPPRSSRWPSRPASTSSPRPSYDPEAAGKLFTAAARPRLDRAARGGSRRSSPGTRPRWRARAASSPRSWA